MHVRDIQLEGFDGPEPEGQKPGTVSLVGEGHRITIAMTAPPRLSPWKRGLRRRIVAHAIDRVLRLPEFRTGRQRLSFADHLRRLVGPDPADG
ncbi:hypothetical protein [Salipiger mucosus]|uniref:Uncharacterized protein n=1 Tax=Salipiger mucosus DSM 16094 TaxID=1123237 RepID=S9QPI3_9RHOB|nr:hypothetical protein [Salipiger mucosus]EPX83356.1 hypothetical protein Salmuc_01018 [Salipiger mucosus DSM 16094]